MSEKFAYIAGLIDGEGSIMYKRYLEKKQNRPRPYWTWRVRIDVAMTDKDTIKYLYDTVLCGWWGPRKVDLDVNLSGVGLVLITQLTN